MQKKKIYEQKFKQNVKRMLIKNMKKYINKNTNKKI